MESSGECDRKYRSAGFRTVQMHRQAGSLWVGRAASLQNCTSIQSWVDGVERHGSTPCSTSLFHVESHLHTIVIPRLADWPPVSSIFLLIPAQNARFVRYDLIALCKMGCGVDIYPIVSIYYGLASPCRASPSGPRTIFAIWT